MSAMVDRVSPHLAWCCVLLSGSAGLGKTTACRLGHQAMTAAWGHPAAAIVLGMTKPPGRYDVTVRVARDDGHPPGPAAFAVAASRAASSRNASVLSGHTAGEIICVICGAAPGRPAAVAVALAVVAGAFKAEDRVRSPSR